MSCFLPENHVSKVIIIPKLSPFTSGSPYATIWPLCALNREVFERQQLFETPSHNFFFNTPALRALTLGYTVINIARWKCQNLCMEMPVGRSICPETAQSVRGHGWACEWNTSSCFFPSSTCIFPPCFPPHPLCPFLSSLPAPPNSWKWTFRRDKRLYAWSTAFHDNQAFAHDNLCFNVINRRLCVVNVCSLLINVCLFIRDKRKLSLCVTTRFRNIWDILFIS